VAELNEVKRSTKERLAELGRRALAARGLRLERLPRPLLRHPEAELRMHLDYALAQRATLSGNFYFVQIGAFDGRRYDPLYAWVRAYGWRGLLIEPQPHFFSELVENYEGVEGLEFRRIAVGVQKERRPFYTVAVEPGVSRDAGMIASFDRETLLSHRRYIPRLDELLRCEEIECEALNDVLAEAPSDHIDLLQIDVEGFDHELIRVLDLERFAPSIVRFEHLHLSRDQHEDSIGKLVEYGYRVCLEENDTLAYRPADLPLGSPEEALEGPARLQAEHEAQVASVRQSHAIEIAEFERRIQELSD
jgi:FkbM family methyltransferase